MATGIGRGAQQPTVGSQRRRGRGNATKERGPAATHLESLHQRRKGNFNTEGGR